MGEDIRAGRAKRTADEQASGGVRDLRRRTLRPDESAREDHLSALRAAEETMPEKLTEWRIRNGKIVQAPKRGQRAPGLETELRAYRLRKRREEKR